MTIFKFTRRQFIKQLTWFSTQYNYHYEPLSVTQVLYDPCEKPVLAYTVAGPHDKKNLTLAIIFNINIYETRSGNLHKSLNKKPKTCFMKFHIKIRTHCEQVVILIWR